MSKYLLTGNGDRLLTGSGDPLMADAPGSAWSEIEAAPASVKVTGSASPSALVAVTLVAGLIVMAGTATNATGITEPSLTPATITVSGSASPFTESYAAGVITVNGTASIGADAWVIAEAGQVVVTGSASPGLDAPANLSPATITVTGAATGVEYAPITIDLAPASISFSGTASISEDTSQKWRSLWLSVYDERQKVLNAIDANNRFLAKGAGDKAQAAADAIIITNTNVGLIDDKLTAEAIRVTDLTASVGTLDGRVTTLNQARVDDDDALAARIDSTELTLAGKASTSSLNAQISRIDTHDGKITANTNAITQVQGQITGKADATAVSALDTFVRQDVDGRVQANSTALTQVQAKLAAPFVGDFGWEFTTNQRGFSAVGASLASFPITVDDGATAIESFGSDPQFVSPVFSVSGGGHPVIRAMIRRRNAGTWDGRVFWANNNHSFSGSYVASTAPPDVGVWSVVEWDMRENTDYRTGGPINQLRFDFAASAGALVDVKWIAMGNYGEGRNAQATQILSAGVDSATGIAKAIHGVVLDVDGNVSGTRSENDGTRSSFNVLANVFAVRSPTGQGLTWEDGVMVMRANGVMTATGGPFGVGNEFVKWFGPDVALSACARENAMSFETVDGIPYFGGILTKESQSRTAQNSGFGDGTLTCPSHPSNGGRKKIAFSASRSNNGYLPGNVPNGGGMGSSYVVDMTLQRSIAGGAWTTIYTKTSTGTINGTGEYEPEFSATRLSLSGSGAFNFEDTDATVGQVHYRVNYAVSGSPDAMASHPGGPINRAATQSNKITVIEDAPF